MKYWRGYLTAAILAAITWAVMALGQRFSTLVDMVYPYVMRTGQSMLAQWSSGADFLLWQLGAVILAVIFLATVVLMIVLKWNPIQWFGWVLTGCAGIFLIYTLMFGLNYYASPLAEDIRMDVATYNVDELTEAATYYRDKANELAGQVKRDSQGNVQFSDFDTLAQEAGEGFDTLTYDYSYSVFAGSKLPVKKLGWADLFTSMGITGVTMGITGEAAVNPNIPDICLPYSICHEMAHRMCIAKEQDANFAAFLACSVNSSEEFRYSAYFMAYRYCYNALASTNTTSATAAAARVHDGVDPLLKRDLEAYAGFFSGDNTAAVAYDGVCDLLVNWHIQQVVLPSISVEEERFDPLDESQVDLSGIVNARPKEGN